MTKILLFLLLSFLIIDIFYYSRIHTINNQFNMNEIFSKIYKTGFWGYGSGPGSYKECTKHYLKFLYLFIIFNNITSIVDYGCGDWQMLKNFNLSNNIQYYGYDVVKNLIDSNNRIFRKANIQFFCLNSLKDNIKPADMIMSKDVLQHWDNENINYFLKSILPKFKFAIVTNDYLEGYENKNIKIGKCRPLNLELKPFLFKEFVKHYDMMFCKRLKRIYIKE